MLLRIIIALVIVLAAHASKAAEADLTCLNSSNKWTAVGPATPCPVTITGSQPSTGVTSTNLSSTVSVTNTFQSIQAATASRNACTVENNGTHTMWVYFGAIGSATEAAAYVMAPGTSIQCATGVGSGVLTDQVSITGTSGDAFWANFQ